MEEAKAGLAKALEPSLRGEDLLLTKGTTMNESFASTSSGLDHKTSVPALERAIARAKASAWPWQLADAVVGADKVLERWRAIGTYFPFIRPHSASLIVHTPTDTFLFTIRASTRRARRAGHAENKARNCVRQEGAP